MNSWVCEVIRGGFVKGAIAILTISLPLKGSEVSFLNNVKIIPRLSNAYSIVEITELLELKFTNISVDFGAASVNA
ncbi:MAG: hypothetical protein V7K50_20825 [Nostoc sp.]|uniref:hypothetical protein n=1 Tax=Nostoc sp. TaxID=1180 RepID=UPI002FF5364E